MLNYNSELSDNPIRQNDRSVAAHFDDDYYTWYLCPGDFCVDSNFPGALIDSTGSGGVFRYSAIRFADAAVQGVTFGRRLPKYWVTGQIRIDIDYTANGASTANFGVLVTLCTVPKAGNIITGSTSLYNGAGTFANLPGPAADRDVLQWTAYTTVPLAGDAHLIGMSIRRDGIADANNFRLDVVGVTLTHIPALREVHVT